jgi:hypothetical protein
MKDFIYALKMLACLTLYLMILTVLFCFLIWFGTVVLRFFFT